MRKYSAQRYISNRNFENVTAKWTFFVQKFFWHKVVIIKTKSATIAFFLFSSFPSPHSFFFSFPFPFVTMILELLGLKKPAFWCLFTQIISNFVRLVFKKSARCLQIILPIFQNVPFWSGKWRLRPFGISAAHFAESSSHIFENASAKWTF